MSATPMDVEAQRLLKRKEIEETKSEPEAPPPKRRITTEFLTEEIQKGVDSIQKVSDNVDLLERTITEGKNLQQLTYTDYLASLHSLSQALEFYQNKYVELSGEIQGTADGAVFLSVFKRIHEKVEELDKRVNALISQVKFGKDTLTRFNIKDGIVTHDNVVNYYGVWVFQQMVQILNTVFLTNPHEKESYYKQQVDPILETQQKFSNEVLQVLINLRENTRDAQYNRQIENAQKRISLLELAKSQIYQFISDRMNIQEEKTLTEELEDEEPELEAIDESTGQPIEPKTESQPESKAKKPRQKKT